MPVVQRLGTLACLLLAACFGSGLDTPSTPPGPTTTAVVITYRAATDIDADVQSEYPSCVAGVGRTHAHPSWQDFSRFDMTAVGTLSWEISFNDAPVDELLRIRISDPNVCAQNATGAATSNVFVNNIRLTNIVDTPGSGIEPGFSFIVAADGRVTP